MAHVTYLNEKERLPSNIARIMVSRLAGGQYDVSAFVNARPSNIDYGAFNHLNDALVVAQKRAAALGIDIIYVADAPNFERALISV